MRPAIVLVVMAFCYDLYAQPPLEPPAPYVQTGDSMTARLMKGHEDEFALFNGRQHFGYAMNIDGYAYYGSSAWQQGSVRYNNVWYHRLNLMYDSYIDMLVVQHPSGMAVNMQSDRVQEFTIGEVTFVHLSGSDGQGVRPGYYQRLAAGPLSVYAKRSKKLDEKINGLEVEQKFRESDHYYSLKDGAFKSIRKEKDLLNQVKDKRSEISQALRSEGIRYKQSPEKAMVLIAQLYNQSNANK